MARIEMDRVGLNFTVRNHARVTIKGFLIDQLLLGKRPPVKNVPALHDMTLTIHEGDRLGVIGHNGAGKSTLLKVLAGVYAPTHGKLTVEGKIGSLFDISLGFEADANGWDNINYRSYLQGETPTSVKEKRDEIAEFSELKDFLNMPVRYYSAGMMVRLAFSIATAIEPEILLVDEVLGAGDLAFQKKARERMNQLMARARLMVLVSHDLVSLPDLCNKAVWMDHGTPRMIGPCEEVIEAYQASVEVPVPQAA
jgi:ABC-type polysaccharide/polyol phosphate transport system ATPase subunit